MIITAPHYIIMVNSPKNKGLRAEKGKRRRGEGADLFWQEGPSIRDGPHQGPKRDKCDFATKHGHQIIIRERSGRGRGNNPLKCIFDS